METETFTVKNIKCGGCVANVQKGLKELAGVEDVQVTLQGGQVTVMGQGLSRAQIAARLNELGYPEA
ncbi:MAG: heavy-metal-associated domain-containing protein [Gammaproteobacteria bacterium]|nr:heavy-metal-associated domain-containing protein [Gammaproteobacteria bacterium]